MEKKRFPADDGWLDAEREVPRMSRSYPIGVGGGTR